MLLSKAERGSGAQAADGVRAHRGGCGGAEADCHLRNQLAGTNSARALEREKGFLKEGGFGIDLEGCR